MTIESAIWPCKKQKHHKMPIAKQVKVWKSKFRVLENWTIVYDAKPAYKGQCTTNSKNQKATIYECPPPIPSDYVFHEILRIAMKVAAIVPDGEELLIQDLCKIMHDNNVL